eukprot:TRINITY_DN5577_c0_g1_i2.p1 TRINITY_DN5577_c0_g1~~TRINITY_DN5577_c0_g1_i2.p1  ORF type:complete len:400 (-),score=160.21 TRINITY_DN5577_c0_g1_i2:37-1236(-)
MSVDIFPQLFPIDLEGKEWEGFISIQEFQFPIWISFSMDSPCISSFQHKKPKAENEKKRKLDHLQSNSTKKNSFELKSNEELNELLNGMSQSISNRLESCSSLSSFLMELKDILERRIAETKRRDFERDCGSEFYHRLRWEMDQMGWNTFKSIDSSLSQLEIQCQDAGNRTHSFTIQLSYRYPLEPPVIVADLPEPFQVKWDPSSSNLSNMLQQMEKTLGEYQSLWNQLRDLDENCWILEPEHPTYSSLSRRIALEQHRSIQVKLDPSRPYSIPEIQFLGPENSVASLRESFNKKLSNWNSKLTLRENLEKTIGIQFPSPKTTKREEFSQECGICYSYKLDNEGDQQIPDRVCAESKCGKPFHPHCLSEWLKSNPSCRQSFNTIFGECPYCSTPISIRI